MQFYVLKPLILVTGPILTTNLIACCKTKTKELIKGKNGPFFKGRKNLSFPIRNGNFQLCCNLDLQKKLLLVIILGAQGDWPSSGFLLWPK